MGQEEKALSLSNIPILQQAPGVVTIRRITTGEEEMEKTTLESFNNNQKPIQQWKKDKNHRE